jgi:hypothetical protein
MQQWFKNNHGDVRKLPLQFVTKVNLNHKM